MGATTSLQQELEALPSTDNEIKVRSLLAIYLPCRLLRCTSM